MENNPNSSSTSAALGVGLLGGIVIGPIILAIIVFGLCFVCCMMSMFLGFAFSDPSYSPSYYDDYTYDESNEEPEVIQIIDLSDYLGRGINAVADEINQRVVSGNLTMNETEYTLFLSSALGKIDAVEVELKQYKCDRFSTLEDDEELYFDLVGLDYWTALKNYSKSTSTKVIYSYNSNELTLRCNERGNVSLQLSN